MDVTNRRQNNSTQCIGCMFCWHNCFKSMVLSSCFGRGSKPISVSILLALAFVRTQTTSSIPNSVLCPGRGSQSHQPGDVTIQLQDFLQRETYHCDLTKVVIFSDRNNVGEYIVEFIRRLGLPFIYHNGKIGNDMKTWLSDVYLKHGVEYFIVATRNSTEIFEEAESISVHESYQELALFRHRTKWLAITWERQSCEQLLDQLFQSVLDNVAMLQVYSQGYSITNRSSNVYIGNAVTFMWKEDRTREPNFIYWNNLDDNKCQSFPNRYLGLNGRIVRVVAKEYFEIFLDVKYHPDGTSEEIGILVDILNYSATALNFTYKIISSRDAFGDYDVSWTDYKQSLENGAAEIGMSPWSSQYAKKYKLSFSYPILFDEIVGIYRRPKRQTIYDSLFFLCPFPVVVYLLLVMTLVYTATLYALIVSFVYPSENNEQMRSEFTCKGSISSEIGRIKRQRVISMTHALNYVTILSTFVVSVLNQGYLPRPRQMSARLVIGVWAIGIVFFYSFFSSSITAEMVRRKEELPFKTFEELLKRTDFTCTTVNNTIVSITVNNSTSGLLAELAKKLNVVQFKGFGVVDKALGVYLENLVYNTVFIFYRSEIESVLKKMIHPENYVIMSDDPLFRADLTITFSENSELNELMSNQFRILHESGIQEKIYNFYSETQNMNRSAELMKKSNGPLHIRFMFWLIIVSLLNVFLAALILGIEVFVYRRRRQQKKKPTDIGKTTSSRL